MQDGSNKAAADRLRALPDVMCRNIIALSDERALLSQNMLSQLRNLVEDIAVLIRNARLSASVERADRS